MGIFHNLMNDKVAFVKRDGRRFENLPASVQTGLILTQNAQIPIEDGDRFERRLPSGIVESFLVLDAGFYQAMHGIPAHYQSKVQKESAIPRAPAQASHSVYNIVGPNARVNIQSTDSSTNVVNMDAPALFDGMREAVREAIDDSVLESQLLERIDAMQTAIGTPDFARRYKEFVGVAADHLTLLAPFLPALSQLLLG